MAMAVVLMVEEETATEGTSPGLPFLAVVVVAKTANSHYRWF